MSAFIGELVGEALEKAWAEIVNAVLAEHESGALAAAVAEDNLKVAPQGPPGNLSQKVAHCMAVQPNAFFCMSIFDFAYKSQCIHAKKNTIKPE